MSTSCPRHKRLNRAGRLQAAQKWIQQYNGKNVVRGYHKHFGVSLICAALELQSLGLRISETYIQQLKADEKRREDLAYKRKREKKENELSLYEDEDNYYLLEYDSHISPDIEVQEYSNVSNDQIPF